MSLLLVWKEPGLPKQGLSIFQYSANSIMPNASSYAMQRVLFFLIYSSGSVMNRIAIEPIWLSKRFSHAEF